MNALNTLLPHGYCIKWTPELLWLYVVSDGLIALAYYSIPFALAYFAWKRKDLHFRSIFLLFAAFILACGTTHLFGIVVLWNPIYWVDASMKAVTAVISVITAIALVYLIPQALKLPSPAQLAKEVNDKLEAYEKLKAAQSSLVDMTKLVEAEYAKNEALTNLKATLDAIPDMLFELDIEGKYHSVHSPKSELIPVSTYELVGKNIHEVLPNQAALTIKKALLEADINGYSRGEQIELDVPLGKRWFELSVAKKSLLGDVNQRFVVLSRDITERKLNESELRIAAIAIEAQEGIIVTDSQTKILRVNKAFTEITGYTAEDSVGEKPSFLSSGKHDEAFYKIMWNTILHKGSWEGEIWNRRKNGEIYPERLVITAVKNKEGHILNYVATLSDITESKAASDQIKNLAFYDPLTQLPNRRLLLDRLKQAIVSCDHNAEYGAVLFLDIDHFKVLNDTLGHNTGDMLLKLMADRLKTCVREADTVARIGGDEFVILIEDLGIDEIKAASIAETLGNTILSLVGQTFKLDSYVHTASVSIGVTLFNSPETSEEDVLKQADIAMYQAKDSGRNAIRMFDINMQEAIASRVQLERELRFALELNQFELYYQVQVDHNKIFVGAEALIRWVHPERGVVSPTEFIPLAEETGLILPIGKWVLETACIQLKTWQKKKHTRDLSISVNVSAKQFNQSNFVAEIAGIVKDSAIDPAFLKLELTESMLQDDVDLMIQKMMALREIGVRFELDDFGTGYSSLQYLKQLPLHQLKIDQSFIRDIETDSNDKALVKTIIAMAHSLDLKSIAEGVENEQQRQFLMDHGCDHFQGYLFGRPMPINMFEKLIAS